MISVLLIHKNYLSGYMSLNPIMIKKLCEEIVKTMKKRDFGASKGKVIKDTSRDPLNKLL